MENMEINPNFWKNRSVLITGHTGFKGGWMALWLTKMGAKVHGYSLDPVTNFNFFTETNLKDRLTSSTIGDIQNLPKLEAAISFAKPSIIIHMAAQALVMKSYSDPVQTFKTNVIGTVNLLEATKKVGNIEAIVNITTDKCYENQEQLKPYIENDKLGGYDPYSSSKACAELVSAAYRNSYLKEREIKIATVRAGNVIGGGDWAEDRLIPDFFRSIQTGKKLLIRAPNAIRPWQHVLEPLSGYLILAEKLVIKGHSYAEAWNFGPKNDDPKSVSWVINYLSQKVPKVKLEIDINPNPYETKLLLLDSSKAMSKLKWIPRWSLVETLDKIIEWHQAWAEKKQMSEVSVSQIESYCNSNVKLNK